MELDTLIVNYYLFIHRFCYFLDANLYKKFSPKNLYLFINVFNPA